MKLALLYEKNFPLTIDTIIYQYKGMCLMNAKSIFFVSVKKKDKDKRKAVLSGYLYKILSLRTVHYN